MRRVSWVDLIRNFSSYSDVALREPIIVTKNGRERLVLLSIGEFNFLRHVPAHEDEKAPREASAPRPSRRSEPPPAHPSTDRHQGDIVPGQHGHAQTTHEISRAVDAGKALINGVSRGQVVDQHHGGSPSPPKSQRIEGPCQKMRRSPGILGVKRALAIPCPPPTTAPPPPRLYRNLSLGAVRSPWVNIAYLKFTPEATSQSAREMRKSSQPHPSK